MATATERTDVYGDLAAEFEETFKDVRGGVELTYVTGEQVISRLNEVLGPEGWSFTVKEHGTWAEADEIWVLGRMEARIGAAVVVREQFGSQKIKRSRASGTPLDIGFDFKGATTDAEKKCAMGLGVGLYLAKKEAQKSSPPDGDRGNGHSRPAPAAGMASAPAAGMAGGGAGVPGYDERGNTLVCVQCGEALSETRFRDGTAWTPAQLAGYGQRKHGRTLCMTHYREANDARKRAEADAENTPY